MKRTDQWEITVPTPDVEGSLRFYEELGFQRMGEGRVTDGVAVLALVPAETAPSTALTFYTDDLEGTASGLEAEGIPVVRAPDGERLILSDPEGHRVEVARAAPAARPAGAPVSRLGQFGEYSLEVDDVPRTAEFWTRLGFAPTQYSPPDKSAWESLSSGSLMVGIYRRGHCPHVFRSPAITYFNEDSADRIRGLHERGIRFVQQLQPEDPRDVVMDTPEGQMMFLFGY